MLVFQKNNRGLSSTISDYCLLPNPEVSRPGTCFVISSTLRFSSRSPAAKKAGRMHSHAPAALRPEQVAHRIVSSCLHRDYCDKLDALRRVLLPLLSGKGEIPMEEIADVILADGGVAPSNRTPCLS
jgi:hypothetical protein